MKRLILPTVVVILAGVGAGSGYGYLNARRLAQSDSTARDSTLEYDAAHAPGAAAKTLDSTNGAVADSAIVDSMRVEDSTSAANVRPVVPWLSMTPSDSIRGLHKARATLSSEMKRLDALPPVLKRPRQ